MMLQLQQGQLGRWVSGSDGAGGGGRIIYEAENTTPAGLVAGAPVTKKAEFMARLTVTGAETWESRTVGDSVDGMTSTVNGVGLTHSLTNGGSGDNISNTTSSGRFNTTSGGSKWVNVFSNEVSSTTYKITFDAPVAAVGFYGTDMGDFGAQMTVTLKKTGGGTENINIANSVNGNDGCLVFWGFVDGTDTYDYIELTSSELGDVCGVDDIVVATAAQLA